MKVAFLKGTGIFDKLIKWWTKSQYSHSEMIFSDGTTIGSDVSSPYQVIFKKKKYDPVYWDVIDLNISMSEEFKIRDFAMLQVGKKYDWFGIFFSQIFPFKKDNPKKWFCSELCVASFQQVARLATILNMKASTVSPGKFYDLIGVLKR